MDVRERFARWFESTGKSKVEVARELDCSDAFVGYLVSGKRQRVGLDLAFAIERATEGWEEGQILASDWATPFAEPRTGTDG